MNLFCFQDQCYYVHVHWIYCRLRMMTYRVREVVISVACCVFPLDFFCRNLMHVETFIVDFGRHNRGNSFHNFAVI